MTPAISNQQPATAPRDEDRLMGGPLRTRRPRGNQLWQRIYEPRPVPMNTATVPATASQLAVSQKPVSNEKHFTPLVTQFLDYLRLEKHFSDYTVKSYGADLVQFGQFLAGDIGHTNAEPPLNVVFPETPASLDDKHAKAEPLQIREFLAYLYAQNYTKST